MKGEIEEKELDGKDRQREGKKQAITKRAVSCCGNIRLRELHKDINAVLPHWGHT